jgi:hypothetical protein
MEERIVDTCVVSYLLKKHSFAEQYRPLLKEPNNKVDRIH